MENNNNSLTGKYASLLFPLIGIILATAALQLLPTYIQHKLRYTPGAFDQLQIWQIISGHFLHLGWEHWLLNIAGLLMITLLFPNEIRPLKRLVVFYLFSSIFISVCFRAFSPQLVWYVGLSGVLHALMVFAILENLPRYKVTNLLLLAGIIAKVGHEIIYGPEEATSNFIKGNIVYQAHAYGLVAGGLFFSGCKLLQKLSKRKQELPAEDIPETLG